MVKYFIYPNKIDNIKILPREIKFRSWVFQTNNSFFISQCMVNHKIGHLSSKLYYTYKSGHGEGNRRQSHAVDCEHHWVVEDEYRVRYPGGKLPNIQGQEPVNWT